VQSERGKRKTGGKESLKNAVGQKLKLQQQARGVERVGGGEREVDTGTNIYLDIFPSEKQDAELTLDTNAEVVVRRTPGHTHSCVSVIVDNSQLGGRVGITGDLFERREDIDDESIWMNAGSESVKLQRQERCKIAHLCDFIVPGHGPMFAVIETMRSQLKQDADLSA